jgi:hypothetical protein
VVILRNESDRESLVSVAIDGTKTYLRLQPDSLSTLMVNRNQSTA